MFYRVLFYDPNRNTRWGTGVYAVDEQTAREVAAIIIGMAHNVTVDPQALTVVEIRSLESDIPTTT